VTAEPSAPDSAPMSREELLGARADVERQISELGYGTVAGAGPSQKDALREQLREILAEIDQELAELDAPHA
jgi:UDP:flavonoid glycosyltransferase YjiC (YdhE family)